MFKRDQRQQRKFTFLSQGKDVSLADFEVGIENGLIAGLHRAATKEYIQFSKPFRMVRRL